MATTVLGLKTFAASDPVDYNEINDNYNKIDNGVKTALQGRAEHNLLDNSDFSNPIAQAGLNGMHGSTKYVCDRWFSLDADATFGSGYITPGSPIDQHLSKTVVDINKTYTAAIFLSDGTIKAESGTFSNGFGSDGLGIYCMKQTDSSVYVTVRLNQGNNIRWAALYEGSYTASTLPAYQPKGYSAELAECQRYYRRFDEVASGFFISANGLQVEMPLNPPMRVAPTVTSITSPSAYTVNGKVDVSGSYASTASKTKAGYVYYSFASAPVGTPAVVSGMIAELSADL